MKKSYTNLLILILFLLAAGLGFLTWQNNRQLQPAPLVSPSPDPTADWKIFTNAEEGFSIKYPDFWNDPVATHSADLVNYNFSPGNLNITIGPRSYDDALAVQEKGAVGKKQLLIGDKNQTIYIDQIGASTTGETVILKGKDKNTIWISLPFPPGTDPSLFDQILATLKFTD